MCIRDRSTWGDLHEVIKDAAKLVALPIQKKGLEFKVSVSKDIPLKIETDRNRLKQVILNLLSNAVKFTYKGSIGLQASIREIRTASTPVEKWITIRVSDTGIGIEEEDHEKLFKIFGKLASKELESLNPNGVGLGLMISYSLVMMLGGVEGIKFQSKRRVGSEFFFDIPVQQKAEQKDNRPLFVETREEESADHLSNLREYDDYRALNSQLNRVLQSKRQIAPLAKNLRSRLSREQLGIAAVSATSKIHCEENAVDALIVDDNDFNIHALRRMLNKFYGWTIDSAYNGEQGIIKIRERNEHVKSCKTCKKYKVIFMDCDMPVMNGYEASRELKSMMKKGQIAKTLIIACTAFAFQSELDKCLEAGMDDYLTKPVNSKQLEECLLKWSDQLRSGDNTQNAETKSTGVPNFQ
eukprot:TRINITY_DN7657_c0_g1_i2.p1 TRINITY_DN7657_c0_g1~~TRINITY_DN7657_c0_g1_i2.p1  ORF type:complete len:411 (+),score=71.66 TRINITY_DN7657_c0_g1_i2:63-1295(+)